MCFQILAARLRPIGDEIDDSSGHFAPRPWLCIEHANAKANPGICDCESTCMDHCLGPGGMNDYGPCSASCENRCREQRRIEQEGMMTMMVYAGLERPSLEPSP